MKSLLPVVILAGLLSGCGASSGVQVKEEQLAQFERGKTTINEVVTTLGRPTHQSVGPDGKRTLMYIYTKSQARPETFIPIVGALAGGADTKSNSATLIFDQNGILESTMASSGEQGINTGILTR